MKKFSVVVTKLEYATVEVNANSAEDAMDNVGMWSLDELANLNWKPVEGSPYEVQQADEIEPEPRPQMSVVDMLATVKNMIDQLERWAIMQGLLKDTK